MTTPNKAIPEEIIKAATCVAVFPSTVQAAALVGAKHGKGVATCRTAGGWSAPAPLDISGGSWGAQLGGQEVDLVMAVTDDKGMEQLESGKFNLGTETSVTAGPIGNQDMKMNADVLTYSRARGMFAGTGSMALHYRGSSRNSISLRRILISLRHLRRESANSRGSGFFPGNRAEIRWQGKAQRLNPLRLCFADDNRHP